MEEQNFNCCVEWKKPKFILILIGILVLGGVIVVSILRDRIVNQNMNQITVMGQAKVAYQPDIAMVNLGVQIDKADKAENALSQLNEKVIKIITAIKAVGIVDADIQTQNYSLYPQYDYQDNVSRVSGYNANQQLVIKVRGIDKNTQLVNKVIADASKAGANQINGITFDVSNVDELKQQARLKAIADARVKSADLAAAAGVTLKEVTGWYENMLQTPSAYDASYYGGKGGASAGATPQVTVGNQEIIVEIGLNYKVR